MVPPPISKLQERSINPGLTWLEGFIIVFATSCASCHFITWIVVLRLGIVLNYLVFYVACSMEWSAWNPKFCWCYSSFLFVKAEQKLVAELRTAGWFPHVLFSCLQNPPQLLVKHILSGWWFQTFCVFPFSWEFHHPNCYSLHDFSEG